MKSGELKQSGSWRRWLYLAWIAGAALSIHTHTACTPNGQIDTTKFSTTCEKDDDCVAVLIGDLCACSCNYMAINKSQQATYDTASKTAKDSCGTFGKTCGPCATVAPENIKCVSKACTIQK